jgi:excalibur calcium-binding domain-containing protein
MKKIFTRLIVGAGLAGAAMGVIGAPMAIAEPVYGNCTEAREAGVTPLHEGDPGYGSHLDRDGDGVACE